LREIAKKILREFWGKHNDCEQQLKAWYQEASNAVTPRPSLTCASSLLIEQTLVTISPGMRQRWSPLFSKLSVILFQSIDHNIKEGLMGIES
jgi:hypothetical protein